MNILIVTVILIPIAIFSVTGNNVYKQVDQFNMTLKGFDDFVMDSIGDGEMANSFLTYDQYIHKLVQLREDYPNLINLETIGTTHNNNNITAIKIKSKYHSTKAILFTGMHHAREPTSMMMNLYTIHQIIFLNYINDTGIRDLLDSVNIYFIPIINVDGYITNVENFIKHKGDLNKSWVRKNRQKEPGDIYKSCINNEDYRYVTVGVDLNRNYGYMFNFDDIGSSGIPCQEDFRGTHAFSEPETNAVKNFIENNPEIKIAFNYHAYGNLVIIPFNYADSKKSAIQLFTNYTSYKHIYEEFMEEAAFPKNFVHGNGMEAIQYKANGEASDWMLGDKHILAFSPELGINDTNSEQFYPNRSTLFKVLKANLNSALYGISRAAFYFQFKYLKNTFSDCEFVKSMSHKFMEKSDDDLLEEKLCHDEFFKFSSQVELKNKGFSDYKGEVEFEILIDNQLLEYMSIKINTGYKPDFNQKSTIKNGQIIMETNYNKTGQNSTTKFKFINLDSKDDSENVDARIFKVFFVESFNHVIIDIKFYINKQSFADFGKFLLDSNKVGNHTLYRIRRKQNREKENNLNNTNQENLSKEDGDYLMSNYNLRYLSPEFKIKFNDFEYFNLKNGTGPNNFNKYEIELRTFYGYVIIAVVIGLIILILIFFIKLRGDNLNTTGQEEVIEEVIDEVISAPSGVLKEQKSKNNYVELHNLA